MNVWQFLAAAAAAAPGREALRDGGRSLAWDEAHARASRLAGSLAARGVAPGDRVACLAHNGASCFLAYFAAAAAGAIFVPLNPRLAAAELRAILAHAEAALLLHDRAHDALAAELAAYARGGAAAIEAAIDAAAPRAPFVPAPAAADAPAQLYYTSGTTGAPKGVVLTHRNVCTHALAAVQELGLGVSDTWAHVAPMFHLADAWATFALTHVRGVHVFLDRFAPAAALDLLARERVTITNLVPTMLNLMVKEPGAGARRYALRAMLSGGAPIAPAVVREVVATFRCEYVQTYGMTETSPYLTLSLLSESQRALPPDERLRIASRTGRPFLGVELEVVGADGRRVRTDDREVGEIRVRGATVTPGYWRDTAATAAAFDRDGFLRTGDLATIDASGSVNIVDRLKDVIKTGGETVFSTEVENALYAHPAVLECAVFGVPDDVWGERVAAAVVLRPGAAATAATAEELIDFCRTRIARFKAPREVRFLASLPKTGSGKIRKRALRESQG